MFFHNGKCHKYDKIKFNTCAVATFFSFLAMLPTFLHYTEHPIYFHILIFWLKSSRFSTHFSATECTSIKLSQKVSIKCKTESCSKLGEPKNMVANVLESFKNRIAIYQEILDSQFYIYYNYFLCYLIG